MTTWYAVGVLYMSFRTRPTPKPPETAHHPTAVATLETLVEIATPTVNRLDKNRLLRGSGGRRLTRTGRQVSAMKGNGHAQH